MTVLLRWDKRRTDVKPKILVRVHRIIRRRRVVHLAPCPVSIPAGSDLFFSRSSCRRHKAGSIISPRLFVCAGTYRLLRIQSSFLWPWSDRFRTRWTTNRHESPRKSKERKEKIDVERNEGRLRQTQNKNQYQSALFILCLLIVPPSACLTA